MSKRFSEARLNLIYIDVLRNKKIKKRNNNNNRLNYKNNKNNNVEGETEKTEGEWF